LKSSKSAIGSGALPGLLSTAWGVAAWGDEISYQENPQPRKNLEPGEITFNII